MFDTSPRPAFSRGSGRASVSAWSGSLLAAPPRRGELQARLEELAAQKWRHPSTGEWAHFGASTIQRWYYLALREKQDPVAALRRRKRGQTITVPHFHLANIARLWFSPFWCGCPRKGRGGHKGRHKARESRALQGGFASSFRGLESPRCPTEHQPNLHAPAATFRASSRPAAWRVRRRRATRPDQASRLPPRHFRSVRDQFGHGGS